MKMQPQQKASRVGIKAKYPSAPKTTKQKLLVPDDAEDYAEAKKGLFNQVEERAEQRGGVKKKVRITSIKSKK